jgi:hypothetical protein
MTLGPFRTDYRVWALAAGCVFVALGFVDPLAGATWKGDNSLWAYIGILLRGEYICSTADMLIPILFRMVLQAVPAVAVGWVFQGFLVVLLSMVQGKRPSNVTVPPSTGHPQDQVCPLNNRDGR